MNLDQSLFLVIFSLTRRWEILDALGVFLAEFGVWILFLVVAGLVIYQIKKARQRRGSLLEAAVRPLLSIFLIVFSAWFLAEVLKEIFISLRPELALGIAPLTDGKLTGGLPSGHTTAMFALLTSFWIWLRRQRPSGTMSAILGLLFAFALVSALARIFIGIHFPSDILAGVILGVALPLAVRFFQNSLFFEKGQNQTKNT
jgi:undecaprenyl-diphosphatase